MGRKKTKQKTYLITQHIEEEKNQSRNLFKFVLVLLSASAKRVGVSRMRDFFNCLLCVDLENTILL